MSESPVCPHCGKSTEVLTYGEKIVKERFFYGPHGCIMQLTIDGCKSNKKTLKVDEMAEREVQNWKDHYAAALDEAYQAGIEAEAHRKAQEPKPKTYVVGDVMRMVNNLLSNLVTSKAVELVHGYYRNFNNRAPGELLQAQIDDLQRWLGSQSR